MLLPGSPWGGVNMPAKRPAETTEALRASLIDHARRLVDRDGPSALTMRALAAEAGCATGMTYKLFSDRHELVLEVVHAELERLRAASDELVERVGTGTLATNLTWYAEVILDSTAVALAPEVASHDQLSKTFAAKVHGTGVGPGVFEIGFTNYLAAEKQAGRIRRDVETDAFGFLIAGAIHNLIMSGEAWPRPTRRQLQRRLAAIAAAISPRS
jgi:AcrR family transcriptional regulator